MDRHGKKWLALLLAVCLLLSLLAGCGKKDNAQQLSATVYVPTYLDLNLDVDYINDGCSDGENLYLIGNKSEEIKNENPNADDPDAVDVYYTTRNTYSIYRVSINGGTAEKLASYTSPAVPEGKDGSCSVGNISVEDDGTIWVTESLYVWGDMWGTMDGGGAVPMPLPENAVARSVIADAAPEENDTADVGIDTGDVPADEPYEDQSYETTIRRHLDKDGNEIERIDISNIQEVLNGVMGEDEYVNSTTFGADGNIYVTTGPKLYALDSQLNILFTLEGDQLWNELTQLGGGMLGIQTWNYDEETETSTQKILTIDTEAQAWGTEYVMPNQAYSVFPGGGDYLYYYQINDAIFGFKAGEPDENGMGTGTGERLFSWLEADINNDSVRNFFFLPDGRVAAILQEWDQNYENMTVSVVVMTATPREELPEKTTLIYATMYLSYDARGKIIEFNKKSDKYRIEVKDYSEFNGDDPSGNAAVQKLNTEILAGNIPDLLDTSSMPMRQYGAKGILEDLWPFIDSDPDLGRDKLMTRPLEANQQDGKLYEIFSSFSIRTVIGPTKAVGNRLSWTLADLNDALANMPEGCSIFGVSDTRDEMLSTVMSLNMDQFVDWDKGECHFDSDNFKALLEFCNSFPAEFSWEDVDWEEWEEEEARILNGKQMLSQYYLSGFGWDLQRLNALYNGDYSFIGYPREDGGCGSSFTFYRGIAMTSSCKDKEGAWSFIRQVLLPQMDEDNRYYDGNYPINKHDFDTMVEYALTPQYETDGEGNNILDEEGNPIPVDYGTMWITDDMEIKMEQPKQEDVDKVMELYNTVDSVYRYDEQILNSITEVATQYFAGDKPLDEAAKLIQSKVTLYVNENK